jgi:hypothetical protein
MTRTVTWCCLSVQAADAIKAMLSPTAVVVRGGQRSTVDAATLVPGVHQRQCPVAALAGRVAARPPVASPLRLLVLRSGQANLM